MMLTGCPLSPRRSGYGKSRSASVIVIPSEYSSESRFTALYIRLIVYHVASPTIPSGVRLKMR